MADLTFNFEIHHGGQFVWNPDLVYLGGSTSFIDEVDLDKLSYFEIQDICSDFGAFSTSRFHYLIPGDKITLYVEGGEEPLAVEQPFANEEVVNDDDVHEAPQNGDDVHEIGQNDDDVHEMHEGGNVDAEGGGGQDFDWLEEGFEGLDFDDDVFGNVDDGPSTHDGVSVNAAAPHKPSKGDNVNAAPHRPSKDLPMYVALHRTTAADNDPPLEKGEWINPLLEDDMESLVGSDDDQLTPTAAKEPEFNVQTDMRKPELKKGMKFPNSKVFREALREYAITKPVDIKFKLNEKKNISVFCINECGWRCYASQLSRELTFQIKTFNPVCTCPRSFKHSQVTASYVAQKFMQEFDKNPNWKVADVQHHVKQALEVDISYSQVYRTKRKATDLITGDEQLQYGKLRDYAEMIRLNDKGSRTNHWFRWCHLKVRFGGQILVATARDANDNIFPVAFAVVEQENKDSWVWFLQQFSNDIGNPEQLNLVFITDRQKGLKLKDVLWRCAGATTIREFEKGMQELKDLDVKAWEYRADINLAQWSKSHFSSRDLYDYLANNLCKSFNAMILEARDKPILAMLEWIRVRLMTKQYKKMKGIAKYTGKVCPNIQDKLEKLKHESIPFSATPAGSFMYEVDNGRERHLVDLARKACSCRIWDLTGLPCKHGIPAIVKNLEKVEDYVHPCYLKETFVETYKEIIQPMPGQSK
ncbi:uncharacterized protein LOC112031528 [Quercus suber]|uniref:uncharacterized protein LOC112031528 n=1 Tax=Quercus suber TaxID=58331 RepID=UPI000CE1CE67|nr:uncharacterized protein LOC112031528 [Quercus suber]